MMAANYEGGYLSDLYFVDLYDAHGNFSSWDSNNNGIFAEWNSNGKDIIDMYPELSIGRLACINVNEVKTLVNKIITYETTTAGKDVVQKNGGCRWRLRTYVRETPTMKVKKKTNSH